MDLKEHPDRGVYVKGLTMHRITSAKQAQKLMDKGWSQRATGETLMNQDSSRSHAIFTIYVETEENDNIQGENNRNSEFLSKFINFLLF